MAIFRLFSRVLLLNVCFFPYMLDISNQFKWNPISKRNGLKKSNPHYLRQDHSTFTWLASIDFFPLTSGNIHKSNEKKKNKKSLVVVPETIIIWKIAFQSTLSLSLSHRRRGEFDNWKKINQSCLCVRAFFRFFQVYLFYCLFSKVHLLENDWLDIDKGVIWRRDWNSSNRSISPVDCVLHYILRVLFFQNARSWNRFTVEK